MQKISFKEEFFMPKRTDTRCIENIYILAKRQNVGITELEKYADLSPGYLSRLRNEKKVPSSDALFRLAEKLETTMDYLMRYDMGKFTPKEDLVARVLAKLTRLTNAGQINWISDGGLGHPEWGPISPDTPPHPLCADAPAGETGVFFGRRYLSRFDPEHTSLDPDYASYHAPLGDGVTAYLMSVRYKEKKKGDLELYFVDSGGNIHPVATSVFNKLRLANPLFDLYNTVTNLEGKNSARIDEETVSLLRRYLGQG